ncbi:MAG TPA: NAD(P)/FAD-dependent oxidoreductase [Longimicrobiaceae bacterium]|nr:NAD(P)/FAD-dependent oxidoreductase [Longimicrobiaceae bacterium]
MFDAVVVGGGPAGSAFAARMAWLGHRVLVLDRAEFPRRKPCGECVNPAAVAALDALGVLPAVEAQAHSELRAWRISGAGGERFEGAFPDGVGGFAIPRETLDEVLLDHARAAGAEVRTGAHVVDLVREGGRVCGVVVEHPGGEAEEIRARLVVGADGLRSVVLRRLNLLRRSPRLRKIALTAHVRGLPPLGGYGELRVETNGCVGIAEVGGGLCNVTVVVTGDAGREMRGHPADFFDAALAHHGFADARRVDEVLATGPFDWPVRRAVADGALLVGDAAGYYDPFTGQGIFRALRGAELAARTADAALRAGDTSAAALAPYERARRRAFASGERMQHVVEAFVSRPPLLRAVAIRFARHPALADALIRVTGDVAPARSLLRPSILARLLA